MCMHINIYIYITINTQLHYCTTAFSPTFHPASTGKARRNTSILNASLLAWKPLNLRFADFTNTRTFQTEDPPIEPHASTSCCHTLKPGPNQAPRSLGEPHILCHTHRLPRRNPCMELESPGTSVARSPVHGALHQTVPL